MEITPSLSNLGVLVRRLDAVAFDHYAGEILESTFVVGILRVCLASFQRPAMIGRNFQQPHQHTATHCTHIAAIDTCFCNLQADIQYDHDDQRSWRDAHIRWCVQSTISPTLPSSITLSTPQNPDFMHADQNFKAPPCASALSTLGGTPRSSARCSPAARSPCTPLG